MSQETLNHKAAKYYACHDKYVLPLHSPEAGGCSCHRSDCNHIGKHPRTENGAHDASNDPAQIDEWWQQWPLANDGLNVGHCGLVVIDIDPRHDGDLRDLPLSKAGRYTTTVITGGGGYHLWYEVSPGLDITNSNKNCPPGIDIRAGTGAYVVAPPSLHASGHRYRFMRGREPWTVPPRPLPASLLPILTIRDYPPRDAKQKYAVGRPSFELDVQHPYITAALKAELDRLAQARPGNRNNALNQSAFNLGQFVGASLLDRNQVETLLIQAATNLGLGQSEIQTTLTSGLEAGISTPRHNWPDFSQTGGAD